MQPRLTSCVRAGQPNCGTLFGQQIVIQLRAVRRRKLLHDLHRRAEWATEARTTPTIAGWIANHER
jgi:hypothetical protein